MSNLSRFLAKNKIKRENGKYAPSKAFVDENGNPLSLSFVRLHQSEMKQCVEAIQKMFR